MEQEEVVSAFNEFFSEIEKTDEFKEFKEEIKYRMFAGSKPMDSSQFLVAVDGRLIEEAKYVTELMQSDLTYDFLDKIEELAVMFLIELYGADDWLEVYDMYESGDLGSLSDMYDKLDEKSYIQVKYKANPNEDADKTSDGDRMIIIQNFESAEEYAKFLTLETINGMRDDLELENEEESGFDRNMDIENMLYDDFDEDSSFFI